jgi:putative heme iron utilization protein
VQSRPRVGRVHARKVVRVQIRETTLTVYDGRAVIVCVPRQRRPTKALRRLELNPRGIVKACGSVCHATC